MATDVQLTDDELIARYISAVDPDQVHSEARLAGSGINVWALLRAVRRMNGDIAQAAEEYDVPVEAVEAALAYYLRHRRVIDAQITLQDEQLGDECIAFPDLIGLVQQASPASRMGRAAREEEELIRRHVIQEGDRGGRAEAWLADSRVSIWALVGYLSGVDSDLEQLAADYNLTEDAVQAAMAFYRRHKCLIDARVAMNTGNIA